MILELPYPPSVGNYWGQRVVARAGRKPLVHMYLTARAKAFREAVANFCVTEEVGFFDERSRLKVEVSVHPPNKRKCDLDNLMKGLLDAMTHADIWTDDSQIDELHIIRGEIVKPDGCVIVEITELTPGTPPGKE
jgi:crossover junction endodeoxyribonuclease RusA